MNDLIENECPNCSATVKFDHKLKIMKCPYCDSEFRGLEVEVQDEGHPHYVELYYAVATDNVYTGLIFFALMIWILGLILGNISFMVPYIEPFFQKLPLYYFIISLIVKLFCFIKINQLKDPRYDHTDLVSSINAQTLNANNPLDDKYYSQYGWTFLLVLIVPIILALIF